MQFEQTAKPMGDAIPDSAEWIKDTIASIDPPNNKVVMASGRQVSDLDLEVNSLGNDCHGFFTAFR